MGWGASSRHEWWSRSLHHESLSLILGFLLQRSVTLDATIARCVIIWPGAWSIWFKLAMRWFLGRWALRPIWSQVRCLMGLIIDEGVDTVHFGQILCVLQSAAGILLVEFQFLNQLSVLYLEFLKFLWFRPLVLRRLSHSWGLILPQKLVLLEYFLQPDVHSIVVTPHLLDLFK